MQFSGGRLALCHGWSFAGRFQMAGVCDSLVCELLVLERLVCELLVRRYFHDDQCADLDNVKSALLKRQLKGGVFLLGSSSHLLG